MEDKKEGRMFIDHMCYCCSLLDLGRMWSEDDLENEDDESDDDSDQNDEEEMYVVVDNDRNTVRLRGNVERERLLAQMRIQ